MTDPYRIEPLPNGSIAIVPDYAASRAIAAEIEARERAAALQGGILRAALDALTPQIMQHRIGRKG